MKTTNLFTVTILLLILLIHIPDEINAQEKSSRMEGLYENEIFVEVGFLPIMGMMLDPLKVFGPIQVGYSRSILKWFNIGVNISYNRYKGERHTYLIFVWKTYNSDRKLAAANISLEFNYLHKPRIRLFSGVEAGVGYQELKESDEDELVYTTGAVFTFQVNFFSCRVEIDKNLGFMADIGIGTRGIINTGFFARF